MEEIRKNPQFLSDLSSKIDKVLNVGLKISNILVGTMLAKYQKGQMSIQNAPLTPSPSAISEEVGVNEDVMYDDITTSVLKRFNPVALKESGDWDHVLDSLRPEGKGTGQMYNVGNFTEAVESAFGVPSGSHIDQRMNFFLANSHLLTEPFFPKESPQNNIFQQVPGLEDSLRMELNKFGIEGVDITEGLRMASTQEADKVRGIPSPKGPITRALQLYAEPELHEILNQLIDRADPSIVQWFKPKLQYVGKVTGPSIDSGEEGSSRGQEEGKKKVKREKATREEKYQAAGQNAAIINTYLNEQLQVMGIMKDDVVNSLMSSQTNKYLKLKNSLAEIKDPQVREQVENDLQAQKDVYNNIEYLNAFSNYSMDQLGKLFRDASAVTSGRKTVKPGSPQQDTLVNYANDFGRAVVPSDVVEKIFLGDEPGSKKVNNRDYVKGYINKINSGEITDPYAPDWSKMVNRRVPYDAFADMHILKSQIKESYRNKMAQRSEYSRSGEDIVFSILNDISINAATDKMLDSFSGVDVRDDAEKEKKKRDFIAMTIDQTDDDLKKYKKCYNSRKKYNDRREKVKNEPGLTEEEKKASLLKIEIDEKTGDPISIKVDENGDPVLNKKGEIIWNRDYSFLKNVKGSIGGVMWPLLPGILKNLQNSQARNIFESNAEKAFVKIFDHQAKQYERYADIGKNVNIFDEQGRSNTELYYLVKEGRVPEDIQKIIDFTKKAKMTSIDKSYVKNLQKTFGLKKELRKRQDLFDATSAKRENHIINRANYMASSIVYQIKFEADSIARKELLSRVPPKRLPEFEQNVIKSWKGDSELSEEYYLWLGLKGPVSRTRTLQKVMDKYQKDIDTQMSEIKKTDIERIKLEQNTTASNNSYLRIVCAEYDKALSKIDKLYKIKRSSYKFASIDSSSIDDTILGIEKDFENLLDGLIG